MNKQEFLTASLPYGLKCIDTYDCVWTIHPYKDALDTLRDNEHLSFENFIKENEHSPCTHRLIIRPLDSLVKECVQADYSNGKPFIPIEMLRVEIGSGWCDAFEQALEALCEDKSRILMMPYPFIKLFLKWHINLMDEGIEVVNVTDEFNPYK